ADVLADLGVKIDGGADVVARCIEEANIGFMFAPMFHPAMKFVQPIRKSLEFQTAFNILGPLANPAGVSAQLMGVAKESLIETIIETLKILGTQRAMVVHGQGLDEISVLGPTKICQLSDGKISYTEVKPTDFGIGIASIDELKGGDAAMNAKIIKDILSSKESGPRKDTVILNAAAAIIVANLADSFESAMKIAEASISDGKALGCLEKLVEVSNRK
ncbi:MAG: anthranilate phosphoribosyltransferase, partial [Planctomycetota bacterium]